MAALEIGRATADQLAKQAKIVRSTTYVQLESLMQKGLMSTYEEGKKTYFAPESPELLKRLLTKQKDALQSKERELASFLPDLLRQFDGAGEHPVVRFFDGKEGVATMREGFLILPAGAELKIIYCHDALADVYTEQERLSFAQRRAAKGINLKSIYTRKDGPFAPDDIVPHTERRFIPYDKMPINSDFYIHNNTLGIVALRKKIFSVLIESEDITQSINVLFSLLWEIGQKE